MVTDSPEAVADMYRDYANADVQVRRFYRLNHEHQTLEFARAKRAHYGALNTTRMGIWEACETLNSLVDESDPDTGLSQIEHCLQTAEGIRRDGHPDWFVLAGLAHDLGKILCAFGEPQWAATGDTFVVGCAFRDAIVYPEYFAENPDARDSRYNTPLGIYEPGCGLDKVTLSWGHDEYMYLVARDYLPEPALAMIRYHSFYPGHSTDAYRELLGPGDEERLEWVRQFNRYDLYTKHDSPPDVAALRPFYEELISRYFPAKIAW
ncbi:MAG: inositol oxygenase [Gammaproteobacteria bacterium]|nr:inositol oxygenase [Gammaproteobacteria bacterium]